ncbi:MAG: hypothetical protein EAZ36_05465, partial [Verrucomicrobia bacterium]
DDTEVHTEAHEVTGYFHPRCRLCQLRAAFRRATKNLPPAHGRERLGRALGLAVPAAEAWYLCGRDERVGEARWLAGRESFRPPYTRRELKAWVYGTERPNLGLAIHHAATETRRLAKDLRSIERAFSGFRWLADQF